VTAADLVERLQARGIVLRVTGDRLRLRPADAVSADEVEALKHHKPEILRLLTPPPSLEPAPTLPDLDPSTVREILGAIPDPHLVACIAWDVLAAVHEIEAGIRTGHLPPRRLIEGRPLADWLPLDTLARLIREGGAR
jgi:hypothetical protein